MKKIGTVIFLSIFFFVGLGVILFGIYSEINKKEFMANNPYTIGILEIIHNNDDDSSAYAIYTVNGISYRNRLNFYSSSMRTGDVVNVYYSPLDPNIIEVNDASMIWFMVIFGSIFMAVGIVPAIYTVIKSTKRQYLLKNGIKIEAEFLRVEQITKIEINGQNPSVIICNALYNGVTIEVKSQYIMFDSSYIQSQMESQCINSFPVYLNPKNIAKNYIDISGLKL